MIGTIIITVIVYEGIQQAAGAAWRRLTKPSTSRACRHGHDGPFMCVDCAVERR